MQRLLLSVAVAALCGGCAHKELKAPCADTVASLNFGSAVANNVPCGQRQPVNLASLDFGWKGNKE